MLGSLVAAINQTKKRQMNKLITMCSLRALRSVTQRGVEHLNKRTLNSQRHERPREKDFEFLSSKLPGGKYMGELMVDKH